MSADLLRLRGYQREAIDAVFRAHADGMRRPAVVLSTGAGKTVIFSHMASEFHARTGRRVLVLVHRDELADQALAKLRAVAPHLSAGKVKAGENQVDAHVVVASVQTIVRPARMASLLESQQRYRAFGLVITDEAHHAVSPSYQRIYAALPDAVHAGFTATMARGDGIGLGSVWEDVVYTKSLAYMISKGHLVQPVGRSVAVDDLDLSAVKQSRGDYQSGDLGHALEESHALAQIAAAYRAYAADRPGVVFTPTVATAHGAAKELEALGLRSAVVTGETPRDERRRIFADYAARRVQVLANCMVLTEGWDAPLASCAVIARPTASQPLYCLDSDTEILTDQGWRGMGDDLDGARPAAYDPVDGSVHWSPLLARVVRPLTDGEGVYALTSPTADIRVSDQHRMVWRGRGGSWKVSTAENLSRRRSAYRVPIAGAQKAPGVPLSDDELQFVGWFMTDGNLNPVTNQVTIYQAEHQPWNADIRACLEGCGFKYAIYRTDHPTLYNRTSTTLRYAVSKGAPRGTDKHLRGWGELETYLSKDLSPTLEDVTRDQLLILLHAMHLGDGSKQVGQSWIRRSYHISTGNRVMADRLQSLCVRRGLKCNMAVHSYNANPLYVLHIKDTAEKWVGGANARDRECLEPAPVREGESVWCVETDSGTIVTRRNGKVAILGNCQMVGRVLRPFPGKADALVLDVVGASETNKLATLVDLEEGLFPERKPCRTCWEVPCVCPCKGCGGSKPCKVCAEEDGSGAAADLVLKGTGAAIDLFASSRSAWLQTRRGIWFIPTGDGHVVLWPQADGAWTVADVPKAGDWQRLHDGLDLEAAMSWGEVEAEDRDGGMFGGMFGSIANRGAGWRRRKTAPSQAQLDKAARLRIMHAPDVTKAELSDMISVAIASRLIDPYVPAPQV